LTEILAETLQDILAAVDEGDMIGKWWYRVYDRLGNVELNHSTIIRELILGSTLERFRKCPNNKSLIREAKVRFDRTKKLLCGVEMEFNKLTEFTTKVEEEMRGDFVVGHSGHTQTETVDIVKNPEISKLKSQIQGIMDGNTG